ncbi:MAG: AAA family ATPase, partial [Chloroflexota bacterium]
MMRISSLELEHIGPFAQEKFEFQSVKDPRHAEIHIFTGVNGSGKSTLLHALASVVQPKGIEDRFLYDAGKSLVNIEFAYKTAIETVQIGKQPHDIKQPEWLRQYTSTFRSGKSRFRDFQYEFAITGYSGARSLNSVSIGAIQEIEIPPLYDAIQFNTPTNPRQLLQWVANTKAKQAFALQENNSNYAKYYEDAISRIEKTIESIIGYSVKFRFSYEPLSIGIVIAEKQIDFDVLPDGLKSIISW